jgi:hypothetical protein
LTYIVPIVDHLTTRIRKHPLASWIESAFGVKAEDETGRLIRQAPQRLRGPDSAAETLASVAGADPQRTYELLRAFLLGGSQLRRSESSRFPIFAFRLHQFLTRGDTVWATIESLAERHLEFSKLLAKPGEPDKTLFPLVFCRQRCWTSCAETSRSRLTSSIRGSSASWSIRRSRGCWMGLSGTWTS